MKLTRIVDLSFDYFSFHNGNNHLSVRTSEYDDFNRCKYQNLPLDGEAERLISEFKKWIERNLQ